MLRVFWLAIIVTLAISSASVRAANCQEIGASIVPLQKGLNDATIAAMQAGSAAESLAGTNPSHNSNYKVVEDNAVEEDADVGKAYSGLGPLLSLSSSNPAVQNALAAVTADALGQLQFVRTYMTMTLAYERAENSHNKRINPWLLVGTTIVCVPCGAGLAGVDTVTSTTRGTINGTQYGNQFSGQINTETTTSEPSPASIARALANAESTAQTREQLRMIVLQFEPQLDTMIYTFNPLVSHWIDACRADGELAPAAQSQ